MSNNQQTVDQLKVAISHLDELSQEEFIKAGRVLRSGRAPRVRLRYVPKTSKREKRVVLGHITDRDYEGVLLSIKFNKAGGIYVRILDEGRRVVGGPDKPIMTTLSLPKVSGVTLMPKTYRPAVMS